MNKAKSTLLAMLALSLCATAQAAAPALGDITSAVAEVSGVWDTIKPIIIGVAVITVGIAFLKKLKRG